MVVACQLVATQTHHEDPSSVQLRMAANDDGQVLLPQQVLTELQQPHEQHVVSPTATHALTVVGKSTVSLAMACHLHLYKPIWSAGYHRMPK